MRSQNKSQLTTKLVCLKLLLLWGLSFGNSNIAVSQRIPIIQTIYLNKGDTIRGYVKSQILGEDSITFCTDEGDVRINMDDVVKIMSDIESEDNINKVQRAYTLLNDSIITGMYLGEIPGKMLFIRTSEGIDTIRKKDLKEWNLVYSHLALNTPMLDKITERRDDNIVGTVKKGIIVYQSYNSESNLLRIMLTDGGFETIRIRDVDCIEKIVNDKYVAQVSTKLEKDSCIVNEMGFRFDSGICPEKFSSSDLWRRIVYTAFSYKVNKVKVEIIMCGEESDFDGLRVCSLGGQIGKNRSRQIVVKAPIHYESSYDEYSHVLTLNFIYEVFGDHQGFVIDDKKNKRYIPFHFKAQ